MPRRELLTPSQRREFTTFPNLDERELVKHYTLDADSLALVRRQRGKANQLGFAVQHALLAHLGRSSEVKLAPSPAVLAYIADQLEVALGLYARYAPRQATRTTHFAIARDALGLRAFGRDSELELTEWVMPLAMSTIRGLPLIQELITRLRDQRVLIPTIHILERITATALTRAARDTNDLLLSGLKPATLERLDGLLSPADGERLSRFVWLRQPVGKPSPIAFKRLTERLEFIRDLRLDPEAIRTVHQNRLRQLAREGAQLAAHHLEDFESGRRRATLVAALLDRRETLTDEALEVHDRLVGRMFRNATLKQDALQHARGRSINEKVLLFEGVGRALIAARAANADPFDAIERVVPWTTFVASVTEAASLAQPKAFDSLHLIKGEARQLRAITYPLFDNFVFKAAPVAQDLLKAVTLLRDLKADHKRKLPADAPTGFVRPSWRSHVQPGGADGELDRPHYELCVHSELQGALRSGDVWVEGSRKYRDFEEYLLPRRVWNPLLEAAKDDQTGVALPLSVSANFETYWQGRSALLELELRTVNRGIKRGDLAGVRLEKGEIVLTPLARAAPLEARALSERLYAELPRVKITDLLADVAGWTGYDRAFKHLQSGKPFERLETLLTAILADGINLGATRMAEATPGATARQLSWVSDWYLRDDTYAGAIAELTNFQHKLPLARFWGDGTTSSSDGQHFKTGSHGASHGAVNARYGHSAGVTFYTHVSDQYAPFHTRVINTTKRDATFVLDGLLYHESDLLIDEHYTDTNGYTEHVFALCHLLGFRFAPRIRNLAESKLYTPSKSASYPQLESMIGGTLSKKLLETHWEDILRLATSIRRGTVTAQ